MTIRISDKLSDLLGQGVEYFVSPSDNSVVLAVFYDGNLEDSPVSGDQEVTKV